MACFTIPIVAYTESSKLPTLTLASETGQGRVLYGREAEPFLSPQVFTLDAPTHHNKKRTHHEELERFYEAYIAEKLRQVLYFRKNRPKLLSNWKCPQNDMRIDLKREAESIFGGELPCVAEPILHEPFPYNELSHTGTAHSMLRLAKNLKLNLVKIMDDVTTKKDDGSMHIIMGDLATIEGKSLYHDFIC